MKWSGELHLWHVSELFLIALMSVVACVKLIVCVSVSSLKSMALISCLCNKCCDSVKYHSKFVPVFSLSLFLIYLLDSSIPSINIVAKSFVAGSEGCMLCACSKRSVKFEIYPCMGLPFCLRSANLFWAAAELLQSEYLSLSLNFILSHSNPCCCKSRRYL